MQVLEEAKQVRDVIGDAEADGPVGDEPRFSKRKREMEPEQELQMHDLEELVHTHAAQQRSAHKASWGAESKTTSLQPVPYILHNVHPSLSIANVSLP